jgi:polyisoprenoid-binding protein YceI
MDRMDSTSRLGVPQLGRYDIDPGASGVTFRTRHLFGLGGVTGTFAIRGGTVDVTEPLNDASIRVEIDAASIASGNPQRDANARSARLLDADRHPVITFTCPGVEGPALAGTLTVLGVSRPIILTVETCAVAQGSFTAHASARIDRTEFGVTGYRGLAARYLQMAVDVRCVRR